MDLEVGRLPPLDLKRVDRLPVNHGRPSNADVCRRGRGEEGKAAEPRDPADAALDCAPRLPWTVPLSDDAKWRKYCGYICGG